MKIILLLTGILTVLLTSNANAYYCPSYMSQYDCSMIELERKNEQMWKNNASQYGYEYNYYGY